MKSSRCKWLTSVQTVGILLLCAGTAAGTEYTWDNWSGDSSFQTALNWSPIAVPGPSDTATFDGLLGGSGVGNNTVNVAQGTAVKIMKVINSAIVDMTIGDGTTASRFDLLDTAVSLQIGDSAGDSATLNLLGGDFETFGATVGGSGSFQLLGGSLWQPTFVMLTGDPAADTAEIGVGGGSSVVNYGNLDIGTDIGSGRVIVGTMWQMFEPLPSWTVHGSVDVGSADTTAAGNYGRLIVRRGASMQVDGDLTVHGRTTGNLSKLTVHEGGQLNINGTLNIGQGAQYGEVELFDPTSSLTVADLSLVNGCLTWTGGTLHLTDDSLQLDSWFPTASLTVGSGMTLRITGENEALWVGEFGAASLTIQNGGVVESSRIFIGEFGPANGTVSVSGTSQLDVTTDIDVGMSGTGGLNVTGGADVEAGGVMIARYAGSNGTVSVGGAGSTLRTYVMSVGGFYKYDGSEGSAGGAGNLTVTGGRVEIAGPLKVWGGGSVTISSPGVVTADQIILSPGAAFNANGGSSVYVNQLIGFGNFPVINGNLLFGHADGPSTAGYSVGTGQGLYVGNNLVIGADKPASLIINDGGYVESLNGFIGGMPGSGGSVVSLNQIGSIWHIHDALNVGGDGLSVGGASTLLIQNNAVVDADGWVTVWPDSIITLYQGWLNASNVELAAGELLGNGRMQLGPGTLHNAGRVYAYDGVIEVAGSYAQSPGGELACVLYGHGGVPWVDFSQLNVSGTANIIGSLSVFQAVSYTPAIGDAFRVLAAAGGVIGRFDQVNLPDFGSLAPHIDYSDPYSVFIRIGLTGDLNGDGFVGIADLNLVLGNWNGGVTAGVWIEGDPSGDGFVGIADLNLVLGNWNAGLPPGVSGDRAVPEPGALGLLAAGVLSFDRRRR